MHKWVLAIVFFGMSFIVPNAGVALLLFGVGIALAIAGLLTDSDELAGSRFRRRRNRGNFRSRGSTFLEPSWSNFVVLDTSRWSLELLRVLEWHRFELLCRAYFEKRGLRSETTRFGADGGVDIRVYEPSGIPILVQCKAWNAYKVGIKPVRELLGVMSVEGVSKGVLLTTGTFTREAQDLADTVKGLSLIDGHQFLRRIEDLGERESGELLRLAVNGDFTTPTCPACAIKMTKRENRKDGSSFWGCLNYPRCKQRFSARVSDS